MWMTFKKPVLGLTLLIWLSLLTQVSHAAPTIPVVTAVTGALVNTTITSAITLGGTGSAAISITHQLGGTALYSVNGLPYTSAAGTVSAGSVVLVRTTTSPLFNTITTNTLKVGTASRVISYTTELQDSIPAAVTVLPMRDDPGKFISQSFLVSGINSPANVVVNYKTTADQVQPVGLGVNGAYTSQQAVSVNNGDLLTLYVTLGTAANKSTNYVLNYGGTNYPITATAIDITPDAFAFNTASFGSVDSTQVYTSNIITVSGLDPAATVDITPADVAPRIQLSNAGAEGLVINGVLNPFGTTVTGIHNGSTIAIKRTLNGSEHTVPKTVPYLTTLKVGNTSGTFTVETAANQIPVPTAVPTPIPTAVPTPIPTAVPTPIPTAVPDSTPDAIVIPPATGAYMNSLVVSSGVAITGINQPVPFTFADDPALGTTPNLETGVGVNSATVFNKSGTLHNGDTIYLRGVSSPVKGTTTTSSVNVNGVVGGFKVTNSRDTIHIQYLSTTNVRATNDPLHPIVGVEVTKAPTCTGPNFLAELIANVSKGYTISEVDNLPYVAANQDIQLGRSAVLTTVRSNAANAAWFNLVAGETPATISAFQTNALAAKANAQAMFVGSPCVVVRHIYSHPTLDDR